MSKLRSALAVGTVALLCSSAAPAYVLTFDYTVQIDALSGYGRAPAGTLPVVPGDFVHGQFSYDTTLVPDFWAGPGAAFYDYVLPPPGVVHGIWFHLPTPQSFIFNSTTYAVVNDHPNGPEGWMIDEFAVMSDFMSSSESHYGATLFLVSTGRIGQPLGPLDSQDLPTSTPPLAAFNDMREWNFVVQSADADPWSNPDAWSISVQGQVTYLGLSEVPEPPTAAVALLALAALGLSSRRTAAARRRAPR